MISATVVRTLTGLLYPVIIYIALQWFEPRVIAVLLLVILLLRWRGKATTMLAGLSKASHVTLIALLLLCLAAWFHNDETLLRLYPAAINFGLLALFGLSLWQPPPMVERFARLRHPNLPPEGMHYTRRVTQIWCLFFTANGAAAVWTAILGSRETWAIYNGAVAYVLMGALFAGEWLLRRHRFPELR